MLLQGVVFVLNSPTVEKLRDMKLRVMAQMMAEPDRALFELSFEERLGIKVEKEWLSRKNSKIKRLISRASLAINACIEDIEYSSDRTIDKKTIQTLSSCTYIEKHLNVILSGKTGTGKTYIACALGNRACRTGHSVKYYRMPELLLEIQDSKAENRYARYMDSIRKVKLLILDDIGLKSYSLEESRDILEITEGRYNRASTVLAGQINCNKWYELFPDPTIADAIMDRVIHNSYILPLDSKISMREIMAEQVLSSIKSN